MENKKYHTVGTVPKYHTVGTVPKYHTVGTVPKYHTVGTVPKSNSKIEEAKLISLIHIPDHSLSWLGTGTSIKRGGVYISSTQEKTIEFVHFLLQELK
jgi:hypothetical protein